MHTPWYNYEYKLKLTEIVSVGLAKYCIILLMHMWDMKSAFSHEFYVIKDARTKAAYFCHQNESFANLNEDNEY